MEAEQTNFSYDLGFLSLSDSNPLKYKYDPNDPNFTEKLFEQSVENIKRMISTLYALKTQKDKAFDAIPDEHQVIDFSQSQYNLNLPGAKTVFPRHKKIPEQKALTKWERFAKDKGIQSKKRSRMVFDEVTQQWLPRWGPGSIKHVHNDADIIREVKPDDHPNEDPFDKSAKLKRLDQEKQKMRELKNRMESRGISTRSEDVPNTINQSSKRNWKDKKGTNKALQIAQSSTASMGLFDKKAHKEEKAVKKKIKNTPTDFRNAKDENKRNLEILQLVSKNQGSQRVGS